MKKKPANSIKPTSGHRLAPQSIRKRHEQERAKQLDVEFGQLQLELSTWATHPRIEKIAKERLKMRVPEPRSVLVAAPREQRP